MLDELRLHAEALEAAVEADQKFFSSIIHYVRRLKQLLSAGRAELTQHELIAISKKIEEFFAKWRPTGNGLYIPPRQTSDTDPIVKEINTLISKLISVPEIEFAKLIPEKQDGGENAQKNISGPCVFVGHGRSKLWARVQLFIQDELKIPVVTYESAPHTGESIVPVLEKLLDQATFAVLVITAEDDVAEGKKRARQNVVHESGLFQGRLGFKKAVMLVQEGIEEFSNVDGLQVIFFAGDKIEHTFYELQRVLKREKQFN